MKSIFSNKTEVFYFLNFHFNLIITSPISKKNMISGFEYKITKITMLDTSD